MSLLHWHVTRVIQVFYHLQDAADTVIWDNIRLTSWYGKYPTIYRVLYLPRWLFGISCHQTVVGQTTPWISKLQESMETRSSCHSSLGSSIGAPDGSHLDVLKQILSSKECCLDMLKQIVVETCTILDVEKWGLARYMLISLNWRCVYYHTWIVLVEERPTVTLWNLCGSSMHKFRCLVSWRCHLYLLLISLTFEHFDTPPHPPTHDHQDHPTNCCRTRLSHFPIWVQSGI